MTGMLAQLVIDSTCQVFQMMLLTDVEAGEPEPIDQKMELSGITGIIGFAGKDGSCLLHLNCPAETAKDIAAKMLGMELESLDEAKDAIGEMANMIAGNVKSFLVDMGLQLELAIPTTVSGEAFEISIDSDTPVSLRIPFKYDGGRFDVVLILSSGMVEFLESKGM